MHHFEESFIFQVVYYFRYLDDTIYRFNGTSGQLDILLKYLNKCTSNWKFTIEKEINKTIHFLDLTLKK